MNTATTKTRTRTTVQINENQISREMAIAVGTVPGLVGIWAAACFIGAMAASGGPFELARHYFQAVTGM